MNRLKNVYDVLLRGTLLHTIQRLHQSKLFQRKFKINFFVTFMGLFCRYQQALSKYEDDSVTKTGSGRQQPLPPPRRNNSNNTNTNNNMVGRTASIVPKNANNAKSTNLNATALTTVKSNSNNLNNANSSNANNLNSTHANNLNSTHLNSSHSSNRLIPIHSSAPDVSFAWILDDFLVVLKTNAVLRRARSDERLPAITLLYSQE